jgi:hypothetical protein
MPDSTAPGSPGPAAQNHADPIPLIPRPRPGLPSLQPSSVPPRAGRRPLPDAWAICTFAVPEIAPPYDDVAATRPPDRRRLASVPAAAQDITPSGRLTAGTAPPPRAIPAGQTASSASGPGGIELAQTHPWPSRFAQALAETLAGSRPASQIVPWTTQQTRRQISQLGPILGASQRPRVRRLIVTSPTGGVLEMTVIVAVGDHVRAVAVRLERTVQAAAGAGIAARPGDWYRRNRSDWRCTAIEAA